MAGSPPTEALVSRSFRRLMLWMLLAEVDAWCCRACHKCMCSVYGVCPVPQAPVQLTVPFHQLTTAGIADFVDSLRPNGSRDSCPPGCTLTPLLNGSAFAAHGIDGPTLLQMLQTHEENLPSSAMHNITLRTAHARWLETQLPPSIVGTFSAKNREERLFATITRVRDAIRIQQGNARRQRLPKPRKRIK